MNKEDYFFLEWVILGKKIKEEEFSKLTNAEFEYLKNEYDKFKKMLEMQ